jgi:hypothetical protein
MYFLNSKSKLFSKKFDFLNKKNIGKITIAIKVIKRKTPPIKKTSRKPLCVAVGNT